MRISFIYNKRLSIYPLDYLDRGMGGTEQTLLLISQALAKKGHKVTVYASCYKTGIYNGVRWKNLWELNTDDSSQVYIAVRFVDGLTDYKLNSSALKILWCHDDNLPPVAKLVKDSQLHYIFSVSNFQRKLLAKSGISQEIIYVTKNVFDPTLYALKTKKKKQLIYCSSPDRGLYYLLKMWPRIKQSFPDYKLKVTGSFELWGLNKQENFTMTRKLYDMTAKLKDVEILGKVKKQELVRLQAESYAMLYPTDFPEMFCISILECQSVGTPTVTSRLAAIPERIEAGAGILIKGNPAEDSYQKEFIKAVQTLKDKKLWNSLSQRCILASQSYLPELVAEKWETFFEKVESKQWKH